MASETYGLLGTHAGEAGVTGILSKPSWIHYFELTRLHKFPLGNTLIFWPAAWGLTMAAYRTRLNLQSLVVDLFVFLIGSTLLHSAGCVFNDLCDRGFDAQVERTKSRPLVTGAVSVSGACLFFITLVLATGSILLLTNRTAALVGLIDIFPLLALYPLMKRWTYWPQAWLGLTMNWGLLVAWIHVTGKVDVDILAVLLAGTVCWTIVYDTVYACQDREDDIAAGVKSTAVLFGSWVRAILMVFTVLFVASLVYAGYLNNQGPAYFVVTCGGSTFHFLLQFATWDLADPWQGGVKFRANHDIGYIIWGGMIIDYYLKVIL